MSVFDFKMIYLQHIFNILMVLFLFYVALNRKPKIEELLTICSIKDFFYLI
jgi:hypothetical protein